MHKDVVRTRFAPSPTGYMHIGNLRTALFEYLVAKCQGGKFILRIEDTDQKRYVDGAIDKIFNALEISGLDFDEGPGKEGNYGPYIQSERKNVYMERALELIDRGHAYRCFCTEERLDALKQESQDGVQGYDRHCRDLSQEEIARHLENGDPFVIRQKMPLSGETAYDDAVFGKITVKNEQLEDQILIKSDGFPTYNFANVVDDHDMNITHVVRGSEYLSSTPKYVLLYEAFGYDVPVFVHLPLINGKDGHKLSKRHGATSFEDLLDDGYLPEAIINYLALLGWSPSGTQEIFSLSELIDNFNIKGIQKSPAVYDEDKLAWFNSQYLKELSSDKFTELALPYYMKVFTEKSLPSPDKLSILADVLRPRINKLTEIEDKVRFLAEFGEYSPELFFHKKMKTTPESSYPVLLELRDELEKIDDFTYDYLHEFLVNYAKEKELKNGQVMSPLRLAITAVPVSPGGAVEALMLLGKDESLKRLGISIDNLKEYLETNIK